jgi:beta-RFAP synthase
MSVRVVAPSRLHFGLFHVPTDELTLGPDGRPLRKYGGVGLMIETPAVTVEACRSGHDAVSGNLAHRAAGFLRVIRKQQADWEHDGYTLIANGPPEHVGLGVGTALGMAVARAVHALRFGPDGQANTVEALARMVERGRRSGVGVHGFASGGLIVDNGKNNDAEFPQVKEVLRLPSQWRVVLIRPAITPVWHGERERAAFSRWRCAAGAAGTTERLQRIAFDELAPAARRSDFATFAEAVFVFNRIAGEPFSADQGGLYANAMVAQLITELRAWGVAGVGQSSWGPTVFAFAADPSEAESLAARLKAWLPHSTDVTVTAASPSGAIVSHGSDPESERDAGHTTT